MIPLGPPWLVVGWHHGDGALRIECLACGWRASLLRHIDLNNVNPLLAGLRPQHAGCNPHGRPTRLARTLAATGRYNDPGE